MGIARWDWGYDGWIVAAGALCAVASSLLGCFLVLRRMSMLGDAISHAVLPGLVAAYFISGSRHSLAMFVGAVVVGVLTALLTEWIRGFGKVDEGASMGVVFTTLFALGLVMIVQAADHVDLDPGCVLYGAIELAVKNTWTIAGYEIPQVVVTLSVVALINIVFVIVFFKELKITSFDPALATTIGFRSSWIHYMLMTLVAVTAVASFESVGNILVVAMMVVPAAAAYMLTDRLSLMLVLSVLLAVLSAVLGHIGALTVPAWVGYPKSTTTSGMMAVMAGLIFVIASCFGPRHGVVVKWVRHRLLSGQILREDILALLYRYQERGNKNGLTVGSMVHSLMASGLAVRWSATRLRQAGMIEWVAGQLQLTSLGIGKARELIRSHRLWEQYLVDQAHVSADQTHPKAERFEHFTNAALRQQLDQETQSPSIDPHGRAIPREP